MPHSRPITRLRPWRFFTVTPPGYAPVIVTAPDEAKAKTLAYDLYADRMPVGAAVFAQHSTARACRAPVSDGYEAIRRSYRHVRVGAEVRVRQQGAWRLGRVLYPNTLRSPSKVMVLLDDDEMPIRVLPAHVMPIGPAAADASSASTVPSAAAVPMAQAG